MIWNGFTLQWYQTLFQDGDLWNAALHSLLIASLASTLASFIGLLAASSLYRYRFTGRNFLYGLVFILIIAPDIVMGTALLILYSAGHFPLVFGLYYLLILLYVFLCDGYDLQSNDQY